MKHPVQSLESLTMDRRRWLRFGLGSLATAMGAGSLSALIQNPVKAQSGGYKAMVCVFLYGGNDGMNTIVPTDATRHAQYAAVRGDLALPRGSLIPITGTDLGLHPAMSALAPICTARKLAPLVNVGTLARPLTKTEFRSLPDSDTGLPDNLYSHSHQQTEWQSAGASSFSRTGWGGRTVDAMGTTNPVIAVGSNGHFGLSSLGTPLVLPEPGGTFGVYGQEGNWDPTVKRKTALESLYQAANLGSTNSLLGAYAQQQRAAFDVSARLGTIVGTTPNPGTPSQIDTAFAPITDGDGNIASDLGRQLYLVANLILQRTTVLGDRQLFLVQDGGYDLHGNQIAADSLTGEHARLLGGVADAMACFYNAMTAIGLSDSVTLFTQSEFGRTFVPNSSSGTDHAWGTHQLIMGGAVKGGAVYGTYPELVVGGANDVGVDSWELQGRWIPTTGVQQYSATLLKWFGASDTQINTIVPGLGAFGSRDLGFMA